MTTSRISKNTTTKTKPRARSRKKVGKAKRGTAQSSQYGELAAKKVERAMHEMKRGELVSGKSGKRVTSRKQAVAIGLSEARAAGGKVPPAKPRSKA